MTTLVLFEMSLHTNSLLQFTISIWQDTAAQAHGENVRILEMMADPNRKGSFEATATLGLVLEVKITKNILTVVELKSISLPCKKTEVNPQ